MIISVEEARQLMGEANKKYTDEQIEEVINIFDFMADMAIDVYLIKRKQRKEEKNEQITKKESTSDKNI